MKRIAALVLPLTVAFGAMSPATAAPPVDTFIGKSADVIRAELERLGYTVTDIDRDDDDYEVDIERDGRKYEIDVDRETGRVEEAKRDR